LFWARDTSEIWVAKTILRTVSLICDSATP
jgi:hypothetical protein